MKALFAAIGLAVALGCTTALKAPNEYPTVNLPPSLRQLNWLGPRGEGSCAHASMVDLLRWQGRYAAADHWRATYGDGEYQEELHARLTKQGIRFAYTVQGDVAFLEWACRTRRGAAVKIKSSFLYGPASRGNHMLCLVYLDAKCVGLLDNNGNKIRCVTRESFINAWKHSGGWAVTPVYAPAPPLPY